MCACTPSGGSKVISYRQTLGKVKAVLFLGGSGWCGVVAAAGGVGVTVDGAEESGLVEAQLLQLLWVLCKCGRKQQLLQRHLRWRQTERRNRW